MKAHRSVIKLRPDKRSALITDTPEKNAIGEKKAKYIHRKKKSRQKQKKKNNENEQH